MGKPKVNEGMAAMGYVVCFSWSLRCTHIQYNFSIICSLQVRTQLYQQVLTHDSLNLCKGLGNIPAFGCLTVRYVLRQTYILQDLHDWLQA